MMATASVVGVVVAIAHDYGDDDDDDDAVCGKDGNTDGKNSPRSRSTGRRMDSRRSGAGVEMAHVSVV